MESFKKTLTCKLCGSEKIVRFGRYRGIQRWWCKNCCHKFADNNAVPKMKTPSQQVAAAIDMYFEGRKISAIPELIFRQYGAFITHTAVFQWVIHFSQCAINETVRTKILVGDIWVADDTALKNTYKNEGPWLIDIIDLDTRFLLATGLIYDRSHVDIKALVQSAVNRAGKSPIELLTARPEGDLQNLRSISKKDCRLIQIDPSETSRQNGFIECWHRTTSDRNKIIRSLKNKERLQLMLNGWSVHYNYFSPHEALKGDTPAGAAKSGYNLRSWSEVVHHGK